NVLVRENGDVWVAGVPEPFGLDTGRVQAIRAGKILWTSASDWQIGSWIDVPERSSVFAAADQSGIVDFDGGGKTTLLNDDDLYPSKIVREPGSATIGFVGSAGPFAWNGTGFSRFELTGTLPTLPPSLTSTADLVIDAEGNWLWHHATGYVLVADATGAILGDFDDKSGLPALASGLFLQPGSGRVFVRSDDGFSVLIPSEPP